jgi:hypothetical protein
MRELIEKYERLLADTFSDIERDCYSSILTDLKATSIQTEILGAEVRTEEQLESELSKISESPEFKQLNQNLILTGSAEYSIKDGKIEVPVYQIGCDCKCGEE